MEEQEKPIVYIVCGMAGAGKTTLVNCLYNYKPSYLINLDPAVLNTSYKPNVDIRDSINYDQLQEEHELGPNGSILTALSLYAAKAPELIKLCKQQTKYEHIIIDAPGQIEVFAWSASGQIFIEEFSYNFPTVVLYVADGSRACFPNNFISSMLYFLSVLERLDLERKIIIVFNKCDLLEKAEKERLLNYTTDTLSLLDALSDDELVDQEDFSLGFLEQVVDNLDSYWLNEKSQLVSAYTGDGIEELAEKCNLVATEAFGSWKSKLTEEELIKYHEEMMQFSEIEIVSEHSLEKKDEGNLDGVD